MKLISFRRLREGERAPDAHFSVVTWAARHACFGRIAVRITLPCADGEVFDERAGHRRHARRWMHAVLLLCFSPRFRVQRYDAAGDPIAVRRWDVSLIPLRYYTLR